MIVGNMIPKSPLRDNTGDKCWVNDGQKLLKNDGVMIVDGEMMVDYAIVM